MGTSSQHDWFDLTELEDEELDGNMAVVPPVPAANRVDNLHWLDRLSGTCGVHAVSCNDVKS